MRRAALMGGWRDVSRVVVMAVVTAGMRVDEKVALRVDWMAGLKDGPQAAPMAGSLAAAMAVVMAARWVAQMAGV